MSSRRARGRGNSRGRQQNIRNQQMDSNGPGSRIRGTPQQILDRYLTLARDAHSSGDMVLTENLMQHAEHYARLLNAATPPQQQQGQTQPQSSQASFNDREDYDDDAYEQAEAAESSSGGDRNQAAAEQGDASSTGEQPPTPQVWNGSEQPAGEAPEGEQPAPQPRRRRRSRVQRQQETSADNTEAGDGADKASGNDIGKPNGATEHVNGGGNSSDGEQAATRGADEKPKRKSAARVKEVESSEDPGPIQLDGPAENTSDPTVV